MDKIFVPILIIAFNRPEVTSKTFEYIRQAKPEKLYVAVDGPRPDRPDEKRLVEEVKSILRKIDWPCEVHYKFNETNQGAEITVSSAISWVFKKEEYAIILEDDIIAPMSFLKFAQEMLIKYKNYDRIGMVTGCNFTPIQTPNGIDYFFAKYGHTWGWATWKRAWEPFDLNVQVPPKYLSLKFLKKINNNKKEAKYYQRKFKLINKKGPANTPWDFIWVYFFRINNYLSVIPKVNITSNIGVYGLHARGRTEHHFRPFDENFEVIRHPEKIEYFKEYDIYHFENYISKRKPLHKRIVNKISRIILKKY